jgi:hypothetical protein
MELDPLNDSISLAGSRCVLVKYSHLRSHFVLDLREFNPYRVRARGARHGKSTPITGIASRMVLSAGACFEEDVVSELPFLSIRKENVGSRVLLDDEWMAEILVRELCVLPALESYVLTITATNSGIEISKRKSFSFVPLRLPRSHKLDGMLYPAVLASSLTVLHIAEYSTHLTAHWLHRLKGFLCSWVMREQQCIPMNVLHGTVYLRTSPSNGCY